MSGRPPLTHIIICMVVGALISAYFVGTGKPVPFVAGMIGSAAAILLLMAVMKGIRRKPPH